MASVAGQIAAPFPGCLGRSGPVSVTIAGSRATDEAGLALQAVSGDGDAFAELYLRYERRTYNLCLRILGSEEDAADAAQEAFVNVLKRLPKLEGRDLAFGSYVFTSARHACYDLIERRKRTAPSEELPEAAIPVGGGVGGGGTGLDPGDPEEDPERNVLLEAGQEEIRAANATLPRRQREVLALRELEDLSYDEIAEIMEMNRNSVAQLISRARLNLRDALRGTALASIAASSADCACALALLAAEQGQQSDRNADWLADHLSSCATCRLSREAMEEAGVSYRAWLPVAPAPFLFRETMARAAEAVDADWSETIASHEATRGCDANGATSGSGPKGEGPSDLASTASGRRRRWLDVGLVGMLGAVLLLVVFASGSGDDGARHPTLAADGASKAVAQKSMKSANALGKAAKKTDAAAPAEPGGGDSSRPGKRGKSGKRGRGGSAGATGEATSPVADEVKPRDHAHRHPIEDRGPSGKGDGSTAEPGNPSDPVSPTPDPSPPQPDQRSITIGDPPTTITEPTTCHDASGAPISCRQREPAPTVCRNPRTGEVIPCSRLP